MSEIAYWNEKYAAACEDRRPFIQLRPKVFIDGNQWCALYGENLQDGVAGFGDSPEKAAWNFDFEWCKNLPSRELAEKNVCPACGDKGADPNCDLCQKAEEG